MKKFLKWFLSPKSDIFLFILALILAGIAGNHFYKRFDMTATKAFSLSEVSIQTVENLSEPLTVHVFFSDDLSAPYNTTYQYVKDLLSEYERSGNENFNVVYYDMEKEENQNEASKYGINQVQIQAVTSTKVDMKLAWMGIVLTYGDAIVPINGITSPYGFEYNLTTRMVKLVADQYNLSSLGSEKIKINFYGSERFNKLIPRYTALDGYIKAAVDEINRKNGNCLEYSYVFPKNSEEKAALIEKYGIQGVEISDGTKEVFGLVAEFGDKFRHIFLQIDTSRGLPLVSGAESVAASIEEALTGFVSNNLQIGYITGHNEASLTDEQGRSLNLVRNTADIYEFKEINLKTSMIPSNISLLFINGPSSAFSEDELYKIDQFLMRGGNILFLSDSYKNEAGQFGQQAYKTDASLAGLFEKYGIKINQDRVYDLESFENRDMYGRSVKLYEAPIISKNRMNQNNLISKNLGFVILYNTSSIDVDNARKNGLDVSVLAASSKKSWSMSENIQFSPRVYEPSESDMKAYDLAVLVEGKISSAYDKAPGEVSGKDLTANSHLSKAVRNSKIMVIGTSEIATNNMFDAACSEPVAIFVRNALDYLNDNGSLCIMRTKGADFSTLSIDEEKDKSKINSVKFACQFGIPLFVALVGIFMLWLRISRKKRIHQIYNSDDRREMLGENEKKAMQKESDKDGE